MDFNLEEGQNRGRELKKKTGCPRIKVIARAGYIGCRATRDQLRLGIDIGGTWYARCLMIRDLYAWCNDHVNIETNNGAIPM